MVLDSDQLTQIIKYDADRQYFGKWSPRQAYENSNRCYNYPTCANYEMDIGKLTNDIICKVLWYEMSFNPARFGFVSPFVINGKADIMAVDVNKLPFEDTENIIKLKTHIQTFQDIMKQHFPRFCDSGTISNKLSMRNSVNYEMLDELRAMIHYIAGQNLRDIKLKNHITYIQDMAQKRYPDGNRAPQSYIKATLCFIFPQNAQADIFDLLNRDKTK